ncbi:MAG: alpha/beta fold hydrolase [Puniceicoccaceae bacterium]
MIVEPECLDAMKSIVIVMLLGLLAVLLLGLLGPRPVLRKVPHQIPEIPGDVDAYLASRESSTSEAIRPGLQAEVIWAYPDKRRTRRSLVYLHGFSSSRGELSPVLETLASEWQANVFFTRFRGHGSESGNLLKGLNLDDWMHDALEARAIGEQIGEEVLLVGTSHGALLASWVATVDGFRSELAGLVLISPNFAPADPRTRLLILPWARQVLPWVFGKKRDWDPQNSGHEYYWNTVYPSDALFPMMAQVNFITPRTPDQLDVPVLVLYSPNDVTVDPMAIEAAYARFPSKSKRLIQMPPVGDRNQHILAGDILSPESSETVIMEIQNFVEMLPK